ncbi:hypothetical protein EYZ11_007107 [Aspergillus tanneri]|nr:hypothetical protein EYZ11_007107 [Aspergillus tanneri]
MLANKDDIRENNTPAVICGGKVFYEILGDSNCDVPQVTGKHPDTLFTGEDAVLPSSALGENYITDFDTLRSMGDRLLKNLVPNLDVSGKAAPRLPQPQSVSS